MKKVSHLKGSKNSGEEAGAPSSLCEGGEGEEGEEGNGVI